MPLSLPLSMCTSLDALHAMWLMCLITDWSNVKRHVFHLWPHWLILWQVWLGPRGTRDEHSNSSANGAWYCNNSPVGRCDLWCDHLPYLDGCHSCAANDSHTFLSDPQLSWGWFLSFIYFCCSLCLFCRQAGRRTDTPTLRHNCVSLSASPLKIDTSYCH